MSGKKQIEQMNLLWEFLDRWQAEPESRNEIEKTLWQEYGTEKAIMFTDMSRFSKITQKKGIVHFLAMIRQGHKLHLPILEKYDGFLIKIIADDLVVAFDSARDALLAACEMEQACADFNARNGEEFNIGLKIGVEYGKILLLQETDFFGNAVNIASKLGEDLAQKGQILVGPQAMKESRFADTLFQPLAGEVSGMDIQCYTLDWKACPKT